MKPIEALMRRAPVIPVLVVDEVAQAVPIATALVAGGLPVLEVTLRTPAALAVIREMARIPGAVVGAGTVLNERDVEASREAGAQFIVSPGLTPQVVQAATQMHVPILPGIANASDLMRGLELGLNHFKFFPAESLGGIGTLKALAAPFHQCLFCPTGGIRADSAPSWLALPAVLCVGGSWLVPSGKPDAAAIESRARVAATLRPQA